MKYSLLIIAISTFFLACSENRKSFDASKYSNLIEKQIAEAKEYAGNKEFSSNEFNGFVSFIDSLQTKVYKSIPDSLKNYAKPKITYAFASDIVRFPFSVSLSEWLEKPVLPAGFDEHLPTLPFTDTSLLSIPEFKRYLNNYLDMKAKYHIELEPNLQYNDLVFSNVLMDYADRDIVDEDLKNITLMNLMIKNFNEFGTTGHKQLMARFDSLCTSKYAREKIHTIYKKELEAYPQRKTVSYKKIDGYKLNAHIFEPEQKESLRPAVVFIFGGGWYQGKPEQYFEFCDFFSKNGFLAMAIDYRTKGKHNATPVEGLKDTKSAIRWIKTNAGKYQVDTNKIMACGWSAGGQLALASMVIDEFNEKTDDRSISAKPKMAALMAPGLDIPENSWFYYCTDNNTDLESLSPIHQIDSKTEPVLFLVGTEDIFTSVGIAKSLKEKMEKHNSTCKLTIYKGIGHYDLFTEEVQQKILDFARK
jgi:acetyl esterase/lipase